MNHIDIKNISNGSFAALIDMFETEYGNQRLKHQEYVIEANYEKAVLDEDGSAVQMQADIFTPFLNARIASFFNVDRVRIGCQTHLRALLYKYNYSPTFNILSDEVSSLYDNGNPYFLELNDGHFKKRIAISELDKIHPQGHPILFELLKNVYFPQMAISLKVHDFRSFANTLEHYKKTHNLAAIHTQVQQGKGKLTYIATFEESNGNVTESESFKAHNLENALQVAKFLFNGREVTSLRKV